MRPSFRRWLLLVLGTALSFGISTGSAPNDRPPPATVYDVRSFGAAGDGRSLDTGPLQAAIDQCAVEGISFSQIRAVFPGGGTARDAADQLAELTPEVLRAGWPEYSRFGATVPAFGLYARHVRGLTLNQVELTTARPDARSAVVLVDVGGRKVTDAPGFQELP